MHTICWAAIPLPTLKLLGWAALSTRLPCLLPPLFHLARARGRPRPRSHINVFNQTEQAIFDILTR